MEEEEVSRKNGGGGGGVQKEEGKAIKKTMAISCGGDEIVESRILCGGALKMRVVLF